MIDPITLSVLPLVYAACRLTGAYAEATLLRARAQMVRAAGELPAGTRIFSSNPGGGWQIVVPAPTAAFDGRGEY